MYFEKRWAKSGIPIVFDFDDAIWKNDTSEANRLFAWLKKPEKIQCTIAASACVWAGNDLLKSYALQFNPNVIRIPITIDTERYRSVTKVQIEDVLTIGWSGSITTIKHFNSGIPALLAIKENYRDKARFVVIGDPFYRHPALAIIGQAWNAETEPEDLSGMDIGIMPLPNDECTRGKCGLKGLQ